MNKDEIRAFQLAQLPLVDKVDAVCAEKGLTYYLIGGTLLGAVRHGGFIPWDPDMDIAMPRADYDTFCTLFENDPDFFCQTYKTDKNHFEPHAILRMRGTHIIYKDNETLVAPLFDGLYLDIFPLDTPPADGARQARQARALLRIKRIKELKLAKIYAGKTGKIKALAKRAVSLLLSPLTFAFLGALEDKIRQKYAREQSGYLVSMASHYSYKKQLMPADIYGVPERVAFEGRALCAPAKTHEYLTCLFGDYMTPPPEKDRFKYFDCIEKVEF